MVVMGLGGGVAGFAIGHSIQVTEKTIIKTVTKEVIKEVEVIPPTLCLDTFKTIEQIMNTSPHCDHPEQKMEVAVLVSDKRWLEVKCKCPHFASQ